MRLAALIFLILSTGTAWSVSLGDTRDAVVKELGQPQSTMVAGDREFLVYGEGRIVLIDGRVIEYRGSVKLPPAAQPSVVPSAPTAPVAATATTRNEESRWLTDIGLAQAQAAKENKLILALFTGSDWCPPCFAFENEVAHDAQFIGIFSPSFIKLKNVFVWIYLYRRSFNLHKIMRYLSVRDTKPKKMSEQKIAFLTFNFLLNRLFQISNVIHMLLLQNRTHRESNNYILRTIYSTDSSYICYLTFANKL